MHSCYFSWYSCQLFLSSTVFITYLHTYSSTGFYTLMYQLMCSCVSFNVRHSTLIVSQCSCMSVGRRLYLYASPPSTKDSWFLRTNLQKVLILVFSHRFLKNCQGLCILQTDHMKSINLVTATMHEDTVKNVLLTRWRMSCLLMSDISVNKPFFTVTQCCSWGKSLSSWILEDQLTSP